MSRRIESSFLRQSDFTPGRLTLAFALALGITACGGGGSSGGDDGGAGGGDGGGAGGGVASVNTVLSTDEQVALAAFGSGAGLDAAETGLDQGDQGGPTDPVDILATGVAPLVSEEVPCTSGRQVIHTDTGGAFALDQVDFESAGVFANNNQLRIGTDNQIRADNCLIEVDELPDFVNEIDGTLDLTGFADGQGRTIQHLIAGGYAGSDPAVASVSDRDLTESFVLQIEGSPLGDLSFRLRGEIYLCVGCFEGGDDFVADLGNLNGDADRDSALAGRFELRSDSRTISAGNVGADFWSGVSRASGESANAAEFVVDGRLALDDADKPECNFDVTYETPKDDPLFFDNFPADDATPTRGRMNVTVNTGEDAGTTFEVDFDTGNPDTLRVNGTEFNRTELVDDAGCSTAPDANS